VGAEFFHAGGRTDRYDKANSRFSQFCERAYKPIVTQLTKNTCQPYII